MAHDARLMEQSLNLRLSHLGDRGRVKIAERSSEGGPLAQDCDPGEPTLKSLQADPLEH